MFGLTKRSFSISIWPGTANISTCSRQFFDLSQPFSNLSLSRNCPGQNFEFLSLSRSQSCPGTAVPSRDGFCPVPFPFTGSEKSFSSLFQKLSFKTGNTIQFKNWLAKMENCGRSGFTFGILAVHRKLQYDTKVYPEWFIYISSCWENEYERTQSKAVRLSSVYIMLFHL